MRWVRSNRRFGNCLALAALALQLALSFGHIHLDCVRRAAAAGIAAGPVAPAAQSVPARQPANDADDYCAICATIYLAANSFLPQVPLLPVPSVSESIQHFNRVAVIFVAPRRASFQSRAPPLA